MSILKRIFKQNTHNSFFKVLAGFGGSLNRLHENRNHDIYTEDIPRGTGLGLSIGVFIGAIFDFLQNRE